MESFGAASMAMKGPPGSPRGALGTPSWLGTHSSISTPSAQHPWNRHRLPLETATTARAPKQHRCRASWTAQEGKPSTRIQCSLTAAAAAPGAGQRRASGLGLREALSVPGGAHGGLFLYRCKSPPLALILLANGPRNSSHKSHATGSPLHATTSLGESQRATPGLEPRAPLLLVPMLALALVLCNADRVIMSVTVVPLSALNGWTPTTAGIVQSSFLWGYALTPILGGALADAFGGHPVLSAGMALWSAATLFTPLAALGPTWGAPAAAAAALGSSGVKVGGPGQAGADVVYPGRSLWPLLLVRAVMGLGEGVALPCMNNLVSRFVPKKLRATAVATCFVGFHLGCMVGLLSASTLMSLPLPLFSPGHTSRAPPPSIAAPFLFFGAVGFLWLALWSLLRRSLMLPRPAEAGAGVGAGAGAGAGAPAHHPRARHIPPFGLLLSKAPVWAIICANAVNNWGYFVLLSWMPLYFKQATGVDLRQAAWFSALPWAVMAAASVVAGRVADSLAGSGMDTTRLRKLMQSIGFIGPGAALLCLTLTRDANVAVCLLAAALATSSFSQAGFLLNYQDIAPRFVGVLHGISNTAGTLAGIGSTIISGMLVERFGSFTAVLKLTSLLYAIGTVIWVTFATGDIVFE